MVQVLCQRSHSTASETRVKPHLSGRGGINNAVPFLKSIQKLGECPVAAAPQHTHNRTAVQLKPAKTCGSPTARPTMLGPVCAPNTGATTATGSKVHSNFLLIAWRNCSTPSRF